MTELLARMDEIGLHLAKQVAKERQPPSWRANEHDRYRWLFWALGRARELKE